MSSRVRQISRRCFGSLGTMLPACAAALIVLSAHLSVDAQLTARQLIASAINDYGPQYKDVELALAHFRSGNPAAARKALQAAKKKNPQLAPADVMFAQLLFSAGQVQAGRATLEKLIQEQREDPEPYLMLGDLALRQRRLTEAEQMFEKGSSYCNSFKQNPIRKHSLQVNALAGLAAVSEARKNWPQAIGRLKAWIQADPKNANAHIRKGGALFRTGETRQAYESFQTARQLNDKMPLAEVNMALLHDQSGNRDKARELMDAAVGRAPNDLQTRLAAGRWSLSAGLIDQAQANAAAARKIDADDLTARLLAGLVARHRHDDKAAIAAFEAVLADSPRNYSAMNQMALLLVELKEEKERVRALGYALLNAQIHSDRSTPTAREALVTLAWVQFNLGNDAIAVRQLQGILNAGPIGSESAFHTATIFHSVGRSDVARSILQQALLGQNAFPTRKRAEKLLADLVAGNSSGTNGAP